MYPLGEYRETIRIPRNVTRGVLCGHCLFLKIQNYLQRAIIGITLEYNIIRNNNNNNTSLLISGCVSVSSDCAHVNNMRDMNYIT